MERLLKKIVKELYKFGFTKAIYLFGSYANKKNTKLSDIDICIIDDTKFPRKERRKIYSYSNQPFDISLFSDLPLNIKYEVLKGKCIVVKSKRFLSDIKTETLNQYLDFQHAYNEGLRIRKKLGYRILT